MPSNDKVSTSFFKVGNGLSDLCSGIDEDEVKTSGYRLIDISLLSTAINAFCLCSHCETVNCLKVKEESREGLASVMKIYCENCEHDYSFHTSKRASGGFFDCNFRFTYGLRCLGKGHEGGKLLCGVMNMPPPIARFDKLNNVLLNRVTEVSKRVMKNAVEEVMNVKQNENCDGVISDLSVSVDGTWMKRGHTSLYGVSSIISIDTGKVLDIETMSKYCHDCSTRSKLDNPVEEESWQDKHKALCKKNYTGSSGGMESAAVVKMFNRSEPLYGVRYVNYLGDGDSQSFKSVVHSKPYDCDIVKLECIGHIQKRVGGRLRRLVKDYKGRKLDDGKSIGGRGRLSQKEIDSLQVYYGKAIRENNSSVDDMRKAIWAIYFHKLSTDDNPTHGLCPKDGWCKYNVDKDNYKHKHGLPEAVMLAMKNIFKSLSDRDLLKRCLHGKTQNNNESFNNMVWLRCPKTTFCGVNVMKIAVYDAVICFNSGNKGRIDVLIAAGLEPGVFTITLLQEIDQRRVEKAELSLSDIEKQSRKEKRSKKRGIEAADEDGAYECGAY